MKKIRLLTIHSDFQRGGAAVVAKLLHDSFNSNENYHITSHFVAPNKIYDSNFQNYTSLGVSKLHFLFNVLMYRIGFDEGFFNIKKWNQFFKKINNEYDVIHLHNAHGYYLPKTILEKICTKPLVWTLHDLWLLTGRCASPVTCVGYENSCKNCPTLDRYPKTWIDNANKEYIEKLKLISNKNIQFVVPSQTMFELVTKMGLPKEKVHIIFNPVLKIERNMERNVARNILGLNNAKNIGIFISNKLDNPEKGLLILLSVLEKLKTIPDWKFIFVGHCSESIKNKIQNTIGDFAIITGFVSDKSQINIYLKAANFFVNPTSSESFGLINIEALIAGCLVISSDLPVVRETIGNGGIYFDLNKENELMIIIEKLLKNEINPNFINEDLITNLHDKYSINAILDKYKSCYEKVLNL